jgi:hypothetical protein
VKIPFPVSSSIINRTSFNMGINVGEKPKIEFWEEILLSPSENIKNESS